MIRCVLDDVGLDPRGLEGVEVRPAGGGVDPTPWAPHEVLVVSKHADLLAAAGALGMHRLLATDALATAAAARDLCLELDRS